MAVVTKDEEQAKWAELNLFVVFVKKNMTPLIAFLHLGAVSAVNLEMI
jgi:hypothetical protein